MQRRGKLIVLEGTDGSGKSTQAKLLLARLRQEGIRSATLSFPQYGRKSAGLIEEYLNGRYGAPDRVSPYAASLFYALDRFDAMPRIRTLLNRNDAVILDRYVDSNAGHQGGKIKNSRARAAFLVWLYKLEYTLLGCERPDLVLILRVPAALGQKLVARKKRRAYLTHGHKDAHERNLAHLRRAEQSYFWLSRRFPRTHRVIECTTRARLLPPEEIHQRVWRELSLRHI